MTAKKFFIIALLASGLMLALGSTTTSIEAVSIKGITVSSTSALSSYLGPEQRICCGDNLGGSIGGARVGMDGWAFNHFLLSGYDYDCCSNPDVAINRANDEYLVVWQQYNNTQNKWEIYGLFVPWDGPQYPVSVTPFLIAQWSSMHLMYPKVDWNSYRNEYIVVWHTESAVNNQFLGIGRRRLGANGAFLSNADYITQSNAPGFPDIAYNPAADQFVVVWSQIGSNYIDIYGGKLSREGTLQGSIFAIGAGANEQLAPTITTNEQDRYLVVWQDDRLVAGDWDIYGQFLDGNANLVGGNTWFDISGANETHPAVIANGATREYLIVYQKSTPGGESLWVNFINEDAVTLEWFELNPGGLGDHGHPAVGTHFAGYFITYEWEPWGPNSVADLYGRMWSPRAVYIPAVLK